MMSETKTVSLIPTWEAAVSICIMCLENPDASYEGRNGARSELMRLARAMDNIQRENDDE
jgi:hypothetical protein